MWWKASKAMTALETETIASQELLQTSGKGIHVIHVSERVSLHRVLGLNPNCGCVGFRVQGLNPKPIPALQK
jgi:hypothetical protein